MTHNLLALCVALSTWLAPQPAHLIGRAVAYGSQALIEANARFHGYDLSPYPQRCGVSAISPNGLGKIYWLRSSGGTWLGPCLAVDVAGRDDFYHIVFEVHEDVEVADPQRELLGFKNGLWLEVAVSACPPAESDLAEPFAPPLAWDTTGEPRLSLYPYPPQQLPSPCP